MAKHSVREFPLEPGVQAEPSWSSSAFFVMQRFHFGHPLAPAWSVDYDTSAECEDVFEFIGHKSTVVFCIYAMVAAHERFMAAAFAAC